jgi:hypothetical protein
MPRIVQFLGKPNPVFDWCKDIVIVNRSLTAFDVGCYSALLGL